MLSCKLVWSRQRYWKSNNTSVTMASNGISVSIGFRMILSVVWRNFILRVFDFGVETSWHFSIPWQMGSSRLLRLSTIGPLVCESWSSMPVDFCTRRYNIQFYLGDSRLPALDHYGDCGCPSPLGWTTIDSMNSLRKSCSQETTNAALWN